MPRSRGATDFKSPTPTGLESPTSADLERPTSADLESPTPPSATAATRTQPTLIAAIKTLHRFEVGPIYLFVLIWGMFVAARRPSDLWSAAAILAFFINGLSLFSGFVLNNYSDYPIDRRSRIKGYVADAVERVGLRKTFILYWIEQALTVAAAAAVSMLLHNWLFVVVKLAGIVSGMMYNAEPIRMKRRGIWNPIMLSIRFGFVPGMIAYLAVHDGTIGAGGWMVLLGATLLSFSRGFWNSVSDTDEDRAEHIVTPAVRYGPRPAIVCAVASLVPAGLLIAAGLWLALGPPYALVGVAGAAGATLFRFGLLRRARDDRAAIALLSSPIRRIDARWSQATYATITGVGLAHVLIVS
jgi:4-hydroxybenzoate polyprenyltransferase